MIKKIDKGYAFEKHNRIGGYLAQVFGIYQIITQGLDYISFDYFNLFLFGISLMILIAGIVFSYTKESIVINYSNSKLTRVLDLLGKKLKKEISLKQYKYITILSKRFSDSNSNDENDESWYGAEDNYTIKYEVVFLNQSHRNKFLIERYDTFEEARLFGENLVKYTGKPLVKYAPKRLTKERRR